MPCVTVYMYVYTAHVLEIYTYCIIYSITLYFLPSFLPVVYLYVSHPMYCRPLCLFLDVCTCVLRVPVYIMYRACGDDQSGK